MDMIQEIYKHTLNREFSGRIVFLEDYGINVARFLTQGVDIWLNTPRRPLEASGTSGQKAAINGVPNFSVLDGWWEEGYNGKNGWTIGSSDKSFDNHEEQDKFDVNSLYNVLETEIIPLYYNRDNEGIPRNWLDVVRESIKSTISYFSTRRMLKEYITRVYNPLQEENRN
ncbi:Glycogen phosphorylase [subsurface metagenome]